MTLTGERGGTDEMDGADGTDGMDDVAMRQMFNTCIVEMNRAKQRMRTAPALNVVSVYAIAACRVIPPMVGSRLRSQIKTMRTELSALRRQVDALTAQRDAFREQLEQAQSVASALPPVVAGRAAGHTEDDDKEYSADPLLMWAEIVD